MNARQLTLILATAVTLFAQADVTLQRAMRKETLEGDLKGAIALYEKTVAEARSDRATAAKALIRMAECHQKLGDSESRKIYERVLREYADQKEAASVARTRLDGGKTAERRGEITLRKVFTGDFNVGISADGRYLSHTDWSTNLSERGLLHVRNLATNEERQLTRRDAGPVRSVLNSVMSRNGTLVAYRSCEVSSVSVCELRISSAQKEGSPHRVLYRGHDGESFKPMDWSPDEMWIAGIMTRADQTAQIGLISVKDGSLTVLKSVDWRGSNKAFFSPNGKYLAYDLPASPTEKQRDVFVLAVDGSREVPAVVHPSNDLVMGWAPNGGHILFSSDRDGAMGLWAVAMADGKPVGGLQLVKANIGDALAVGVTRDGSLYLGFLNEKSDIEVVPLDPVTGQPAGPPTRPLHTFVGTNGTPAWSADGKRLAYVSRRGPNQTPTIGVRDMASGMMREIQPEPGFQYLTGISWSPDGTYIVGFAADLKGRDGIYRIDAATGKTEAILNTEKVSNEGFGWSPDGKRLYYHGASGTVFAREMATGTARAVLRGLSSPVSVSPDGRSIATTEVDPATGKQTIVVIAIEGGSRRKLMEVSAPQGFNRSAPMTWTPDSRAVLVRKMLTGGGERSELWRAPVDGDAPRKLDVEVNQVRLYTPGKIQLSPDGCQLAYVVGGSIGEVWVLENFVSALNRKQ